MNQQPAKQPKRLYLSQHDKKLAGVCGGIGEFFGVDPTLIRLAWILFTALTAFIPGILAYIVAAMVMPSKARDEAFYIKKNGEPKPRRPR
jgi:phage shock protein PspC (stress-responsive transcriptional regulator)